MAGESLAGNDSSEASCTLSSGWLSVIGLINNIDETSLPFPAIGSPIRLDCC
jgi:hypothetical protein